MLKIILASKSKVRKQILDKNNIITEVQNSNLDEDIVKESLLKEKATPELISKNLAELKANKVSQKNQNFLIKSFPPLQTMENFLFQLIWIGVILLTLSLGSGFLFYENLFEQKLLHKVTLSFIAWITFIILLWGRYNKGWRGNTAIGWTWAGFISILMAYVGSKIVIEFLLI